jgi:hypothetical protein
MRLHPGGRRTSVGFTAASVTAANASSAASASVSAFRFIPEVVITALELLSTQLL